MHPLEFTANSAFLILFILTNEDHAVPSIFFIDEGQLNQCTRDLKNRIIKYYSPIIYFSAGFYVLQQTKI